MRYAIHFGINKYDPAFYGPGVSLNMCVKDAGDLAMITGTGSPVSAGFDECRLTLDGHATISEFHRQISDHAKKAKRGDIVLFSQSSHGTYQDGPDGKRSTGLCMNDGILWDFEARDAIKQFNAGVLFVWLTDACFSESNWRFVAMLGQEAHGQRTARFFRLAKPQIIHPTQGNKKDIKASMLAFSSSNIYQPSYEDGRGGAYTQSIIKAFTEDPTRSWYSLHRRASQLVAMDFPQTPVFEGVKSGPFTAKRAFTYNG